MARKRRGGRKFRRYIRGRILSSQALGALGTNTLIGTLVADVVNERTWVSSIKASWSLADITPMADEGPVVCGVAHGDYSDAEVEAWLELSTSWDESDLVSKEIARRKCRIVGTFTSPASSSTQRSLADGKQITTKLGWVLGTGETLRLWAYNQGSQNLVTGGELHVQGHANLWPM